MSSKLFILAAAILLSSASWLSGAPQKKDAASTLQEYKEHFPPPPRPPAGSSFAEIEAWGNGGASFPDSDGKLVSFRDLDRTADALAVETADSAKAIAKFLEDDESKIRYIAAKIVVNLMHQRDEKIYFPLKWAVLKRDDPKFKKLLTLLSSFTEKLE